MLDLRRCEGCPIQGQYDPMEGVGNETAPYLVVTDVPSQAAAAENRLIGPETMRQFGASMTGERFQRDDFQFIPIVHCAYDPNEYPSKEKRAIHKHCRQHLVEHIRATRPEVIMPLGAAPSATVFNRGTRITKVRGLPHAAPQFGAPVFPLLDPLQVVRYPQNIPIFEADCASFGRFVDSGLDVAAEEEERGAYQIVDDLQFLIDQQADLLAFDTETTSLRWYKQGVDVRTYVAEAHENSETFVPRAQILTMQFCTKAGEAYMLVWDHPERPIAESRKPRLRNQLRQLLCNPNTLVIGQNTKYDAVMLWMLEDIRFRIGGDTMMLAALIDENAMEKNLDYLTKIHSKELAGYADRFNAEVDKGRMWQTSIEQIRGYGCGDVDATMQVYLKQEEKVAADEKLWAHYCRVSIPGMNAIVALESRGMYIDESKIDDFEAFMRVEVRRQYESLIAQVPRTIKRRHVEIPRFKGDATKALAFSRAEFVRDILFNDPDGFRLQPKVFTKSTKSLNDAKHQVPSTSSKDHLPFFFDTEPFTYELAEYIKDERLLSSNVVGFRNKYVVGGKVRPSYWLTTAVTGRTASSDPNGQNYPKRSKKSKRYREMFTPPPGYYVVELDLSQAELRIAASMSGDPTMLRIYREGGDIHIETALIVLSVTRAQFDALPKAEQKEARQKAKAVNFGFLYGMGWRKFIIYAKTQYNVVFTEAEAKRIRKGFFQKYSYLVRWHEAIRAHVRKHKMVRSYTGRVRHLPMIRSVEEWVQQEAERQGINSPVQETGSSIGVMTLGRIEEELDTQIVMPVGFIHDAIVAYVKCEHLEWGVKTLKRYMETNPIEEWFGNRIACPIVADAGFGESLGDIHELAGLDLARPYDFQSLVDKEGRPLIVVPHQRVPANDGRATRSVYTLPTDREPEPRISFRRLAA